MPSLDDVEGRLIWLEGAMRVVVAALARLTIGDTDLVSLNLRARERATIVEALHRSAGVQTKAAKLLGVSERVLFWKLNKHGLPHSGTEWSARKASEKLNGKKVQHADASLPRLLVLPPDDGPRGNRHGADQTRESSKSVLQQ